MPQQKKGSTTVMKILGAIDTGKLDRYLDELSRAIRARREVIRHREAMVNVETLKKGDRVRLVNLRPKYLTQYDAIIVKPALARNNEPGFVIDLDTDLVRVGRYSTKGVTVPASCVEKI